jgi:hypothetical protein
MSCQLSDSQLINDVASIQKLVHEGHAPNTVYRRSFELRLSRKNIGVAFVLMSRGVLRITN